LVVIYSPPTVGKETEERREKRREEKRRKTWLTSARFLSGGRGFLSGGRV